MEHLIITLIQTIGFAIVWRMAGSGYKRYWFFILGGLLLMLSITSWQELVGLAGAMTLLRILPTGEIFAAINGRPQYEVREKDVTLFGRYLFTVSWQWMHDAAWWVHTKLPAIPVTRLWYRYGIIYAAVRNSLAIPFILLSGHYGLLIFLATGFVYYVFGRLSRGNLWVQPVMLSEVVFGILFAISLTF